MVLEESFRKLKHAGENLASSVQNYAPREVLLAQIAQQRKFVNSMLDEVEEAVRNAKENDINPYPEDQQ